MKLSMLTMGSLRLLRSLLMVTGLLACSGTERELPAVNVSACSLYETFYEQLPERDGLFFRSRTLPLPPIAGGQFDLDSEMGRQFLEGQRVSVIQKLREELAVDASGYFDELESPPVSIASCFGNGRPDIHDGPLDQAQLREALQSFGHRSGATLVTVSPVAISPDGHHAVIYATFECGGLCGNGAFYVFERRQGDWIGTGTLGVWVS